MAGRHETEAGQVRTARRLRVAGRVQGVGFRYFARSHAEALGVAGWVRNLPDGRTVEAHIEGPPESVREAAEWIGRGPAGARVEEVAAQDVDPEGARGFEIRA